MAISNNGSTRRPSISHVMSFLKTSSSGSTSSGLQTPYTAGANPHGIRISEPRLLSTDSLQLSSRFGSLGSGATVVRTPQDALAAASVLYNNDNINHNNELPPSPPDSPPLPPVPDDVDEDHDRYDVSILQQKKQKQKHHSPPPSRPIPPTPTMSVVHPESIPLPPTPKPSPRMQLSTMSNSSNLTISTLPTPLDNNRDSSAGSTTADSYVNQAAPSSSSSSTFPLPPIPNPPPPLQQAFAPLLLPNSHIPKNIHTLDPSHIIVSLETAEKKLRTTLGTLFSRESRLAEWLKGVVGCHSNSANFSSISATSSIDARRAEEGEQDEDKTDVESISESESVYSQVEDDTTLEGFASIFHNHLMESGVLSAFHSRPVSSLKHNTATPSAGEINNKSKGKNDLLAGISAQAHIRVFLDRDSTP